MTIKTWQELKTLSNNQWPDDECMKEEIAQLRAANAELDRDNANCPTCGEDGGTSCGAVHCGLLEMPEHACCCDAMMAAAKLADVFIDWFCFGESGDHVPTAIEVREALKQAGVK